MTESENKLYRSDTDQEANRIAIGNRIKTAIKEAGRSQLDASTGLDIPLSTLRNWLRGGSEPSGTQIAQISDYTGKSINWLIRGVDEAKEESQANSQNLAVSPSQDGFLDPDVVLREAEFILDAFSSLQGQVTPAGAASALIDRVRERMRLMRENEEQEDDRNGKIRA